MAVEDGGHRTDGAATAIDGATAATFTPRDRDVTKFLSVKVKYTDGKGKDEVTKVLETAVAPVAAPRFYDKALTEDDEKVVSEFELKLAENTAADMETKMEGDIFVGHRTDDPETVLTYTVGGTDAAVLQGYRHGCPRQQRHGQAPGPRPAGLRGQRNPTQWTVTATDSDGLRWPP